MEVKKQKYCIKCGNLRDGDNLLWCIKCNKDRIDRLSKKFDDIEKEIKIGYEGKS